jgi:hypothetical protein
MEKGVGEWGGGEGEREGGREGWMEGGKKREREKGERTYFFKTRDVIGRTHLGIHC